MSSPTNGGVLLIFILHVDKGSKKYFICYNRDYNSDSDQLYKLGTLPFATNAFQK